MRAGARITCSSLCLILHGRALNLVPLVHLLQLESPPASSLLSVCLSASPLCLCTTEVGAEWVWQGKEFAWEEVTRPLSFRAVRSPKDPFSCPLSHLRTVFHPSSCCVHCKTWHNLLIFPLLGVRHIFQQSTCQVASRGMNFGVGLPQLCLLWRPEQLPSIC